MSALGRNDGIRQYLRHVSYICIFLHPPPERVQKTDNAHVETLTLSILLYKDLNYVKTILLVFQ
jgi:hypothetical protein